MTLDEAMDGWRDALSQRDALRLRLAEAEALLREAQDEGMHGELSDRIDAFLAADSATHRENERE